MWVEWKWLLFTLFFSLFWVWVSLLPSKQLIRIRTVANTGVFIFNMYFKFDTYKIFIIFKKNARELLFVRKYSSNSFRWQYINLKYFFSTSFFTRRYTERDQEDLVNKILAQKLISMTSQKHEIHCQGKSIR